MESELGNNLSLNCASYDEARRITTFVRKIFILEF